MNKDGFDLELGLNPLAGIHISTRDVERWENEFSYIAQTSSVRLLWDLKREPQEVPIDEGALRLFPEHIYDDYGDFPPQSVQTQLYNFLQGDNTEIWYKFKHFESLPLLNLYHDQYELVQFEICLASTQYMSRSER